MNNVILSASCPQFADVLSRRGYNTIESAVLPSMIRYEQDHTDMQCLIIDDTAFVLKECRQLAAALAPMYNVVLTKSDIGGKYPLNVCLNAAVVGKSIIVNTAYLNEAVKKYAISHGYQLIHVNQGYAKCSCAIVSDHAIITADNGIYYSLKEANIEVLKIRQGSVTLKGADCGFIGGASGLDSRGDQKILYFSGMIESHPDYPLIKDFCDKHQTKIISLTNNELTDIGGMIFC